MKTIDLSPKMSIKPASVELTTEYISGDLPLGQNIGGLQAFSDKLIRGHGNKIFGQSSLGIWLGAADFPDAPFSVDMEGNIIASSLDLSTYVSKTGTNEQVSGTIRLGTGTGAASIILDGANKRIIVNDGTHDRVLIGYQSGGF